MGEMSRVNPRFSSAVSTVALAACTDACAAWICASRGFHLRFGGLHLRLGREIVLRGVVQVLLRDGLLLRERNVAVHIQLRSHLIGFGHRHLRLRLSELRIGLRQLSGGAGQLPFRLIQHCLERPRIDLKQKLPLFHERAFGVFLLQQVTGHLRLDVRVHQAVQRPNPFAVDGNVAL